MSKRFGRNQRRAARERVAKLEQALKMDRALLAHVGERKRQLEGEIANAKRIAGRMSVLFDPQTMSIPGQARAMVDAAQSAWFDPTRSIEDFTTASLQRIPLDVLLTKVDPHKLRSAVHVKVQFSDHAVGYAATEEALHYMPEDVFIEHTSRSIAMELSRQLAGILPARGWRVQR
jgi:hypothetical protein